MANTTIYLRVIMNWAKVQTTDVKYEVYTLDFHPDEPSWGVYKESGLQLKIRETDSEGKPHKDGDFIKVRRPVSKKSGKELVDMGPPQVLLKNDEGTYEVYKGLIGNGSVGVIKLRVYDADRGPGHELLSVAVDELVSYGETISVGDEVFPF